MKLQNQHQDYRKLNVLISKEESNAAFMLAKSMGMTYMGWIGQLIRRELSQAKSTSSDIAFNQFTEGGKPL